VTVVDAVIEEARQRCRRRRGTYGAAVALVTLVGVVLFVAVEGTTSSTGGSPALPARSGLPVQKASLVAHFSKMHVGWVLVYDDGRVTWQPELPGRASRFSIVERRLTPVGLDLVRSGAVEPGAFLQSTESSLPASLWADHAIRRYVPSTYAVCYWEKGRLRDATRVVGRLPARASALLRGKERTYNIDFFLAPPQGTPVECSELTTAEARTLRRTLYGAGFFPSAGDGNSISFTVPARGVGEPAKIGMWLKPILPHGEWISWGG
jgi:hypothetical protein